MKRGLLFSDDRDKSVRGESALGGWVVGGSVRARHCGFGWVCFAASDLPVLLSDR